MTLLARDEADIVEAQLAYHLNAGVDFVVATDNGSTDGTTEILERYERAGVLHLIREFGDDMRQAEWVTRMARLAATDFGGDWVINSDADEFWWPRGGSLRDVLATVPSRYGVVRGCWRHFPPRPDNGAAFYERMTARLCTPAPPGDKRTILHAHQKVAHRAAPDVAVEPGNHNASGTGLEPIRVWHPIEVLHFSLRTAAQMRRKGKGGWLRNPDYEPTEHEIRLIEAYSNGTTDQFFRDHVVADAELEHGLADGIYAIDTRLRDALRNLRASDGSFPAPAPPRPGRLTFPPPDVEANAAYACEASTLVEIDAIIRAEQRVQALEERLQVLERARRRLARR
jgi:Glycosyl transferase family 2